MDIKIFVASLNLEERQELLDELLSSGMRNILNPGDYWEMRRIMAVKAIRQRSGMTLKLSLDWYEQHVMVEKDALVADALSRGWRWVNNHLMEGGESDRWCCKNIPYKDDKTFPHFLFRRLKETE